MLARAPVAVGHYHSAGWPARPSFQIAGWRGLVIRFKVTKAAGVYFKFLLGVGVALLGSGEEKLGQKDAPVCMEVQ